MVIEVIHRNITGGNELGTLSQRETFWIETISATEFPGLNEELDFSVFSDSMDFLLIYLSRDYGHFIHTL